MDLIEKAEKDSPIGRGLSVRDVMEKAKDLFLLAFWSVLYFLRIIIEIPYLWIKSWFNK